MRVKHLITQFVRYVFVGGIAFVADFLTLSFVYKILLCDFHYGLLLGTASGFIVGTIVNYCISKKFVFLNDTSRTKNTFLEFLMYTIIGFFGLLLTEAGMYLGVEIMLCNYAITKFFVAGIVLLWNFLARRFLVYK